MPEAAPEPIRRPHLLALACATAFVALLCAPLALGRSHLAGYAFRQFAAALMVLGGVFAAPRAAGWRRRG